LFIAVVSHNTCNRPARPLSLVGMPVEPECLVKARILDYVSLGNYALAGIRASEKCFVLFCFVSFETPIDLAGKRSVSA
jgi:hypothetical protein